MSTTDKMGENLKTCRDRLEEIDVASVVGVLVWGRGKL